MWCNRLPAGQSGYLTDLITDTNGETTTLAEATVQSYIRIAYRKPGHLPDFTHTCSDVKIINQQSGLTTTMTESTRHNDAQNTHQSTSRPHRGDDRTLGDYEYDVDMAREDDNFRVLELPADLVDEHLTKTFTPDRYAKLCRDVAYFHRRVGDPPIKDTGDGHSSPGSGMRRASDGALYNLQHRKRLLERAVDLGFISITNNGGFSASEDEWRFQIKPRGEWYLTHYYGDDHMPVRHIYRQKLSRHTAATNLDKVIIQPDEATAIKSADEYAEQVSCQGPFGGDPDVGYYHIDRDPVTAPDTDPADESLVAWIDDSQMPKQFDVDSLSGDVYARCDIERLAAQSNFQNPVWLAIQPVGDGSDDLEIVQAQNESAISVTEDNGRKLGIQGNYEPFVESGAKDSLKETTDAAWNDDYKKWYVTPEEFLIGVEAMLRADGANRVTILASTVATYTEYL